MQSYCRTISKFNLCVTATLISLVSVLTANRAVANASPANASPASVSPVNASLVSSAPTTPQTTTPQTTTPQTTTPQTQPKTLTVKRGLTAQLQFSHPEASLKATPDQSMDAEVLVRLERTAQKDSNFQYTLWFFGTVAGNYDLANFVVTGDGSPVPDSQALPPMMAQVVSDLPSGRGTNLYEIKDPALIAPGGYRAILIVFAVMWTAVPVVWGYLRWKATRPEPVKEVIPLPTLSDRLRPLVQQASEGQLSVEEQSRLELLIYVFWQRRLSLPESMVDALPVMRRHVEAGGLLRSLEAWIHDEASSSPNLDSAKMEELLAPYQTSDVGDTRDDDVNQPSIVVGGTA